jgi:predicted ATPase
MITRFWLKDFKSYGHDTLLPLAPLTVLIGANASGKSNAIEGIRLLSGLARGQYLTDVVKALQTDESMRGRLEDLPYEGKSEFGLGCDFSDQEPWTHYRLNVGLVETELVVVGETIGYPDATFPLYRVEKLPGARFGHALEIAYNNFARGGVKPRITCDNRQALFTQLTTPARFAQSRARDTIPQVAQALRQRLESILFLDPNPRRMRSYSFITDTTLAGDGAHLSSVLHHLVREKGQKQQLLEFIRSLPEQDITDVDFLSTPRNEVMVQLQETFGVRAKKRDATILSDGTLRVLAVAAALLSAPGGSVVVIEEIDNGVHPSRAHSLLENIQGIASERNLRVLLTTHNPALLDALPLTAIPHVVCCYRDPVVGDSRLIPLESVAEYPEIIAQGSIGSLMTRGILDRYLKRAMGRSPDEKRNAALAWLRRLEQEAHP